MNWFVKAKHFNTLQGIRINTMHACTHELLYKTGEYKLYCMHTQYNSFLVSNSKVLLLVIKM